MQVENWDIDKLIPFENNARVHDDKSIKAIKSSVDRFDWLSPIVVDKDGVIIMGHGRREAALELGMTEVPVLVADWLTENEVAAAREADNMTQDLSFFDFEKLNMNLEEIDWLDVDMSEFGFKLDDELFGEAEEDDYTEEQAQEAPSRVQRGEIWQLGEHRLMCGDSTSETDVEMLMGGASCDICFTSPPYNVNKDWNGSYGENQYLQGDGAYNSYSDNLDDSDYSKLLIKSCNLAIKNCDDVFYNIGCTKGGLKGTAIFIGSMSEHFAGVIAWKKNTAFVPQYECQHGCLTNLVEPVYIFNKEQKRKLHHPQWSREHAQYNFIETENASKNEYASIHGATFPVAFASHFIERYTDSSVLDLFGGTGTTLIAAEQSGRKCYMMELDPHYCDVIIDRWEKLTGQEAVKVA